MKKLTYLSLFLLLPYILPAQWYSQNSGTMLNLIKVCFTDTLNGWVTGSEGIILHTDDGGDNWEEQTIGTANNLNGVHFTDSHHGWTGGDLSIIYRTIDGGDNWEEIEHEGPPFLYEVYFSDTLNGWVLGLDIQHTSDGGETWELQFDPGFALPHSGGLSFTDSLTGWAAKSTTDGSTGRTHSYILNTIDGGTTWYYQFDDWDHSTPYLSDIYFIDSTKGWVVGGYYSNWEIILVTTDGGNNWDTAYINEPGNLRSIYFADAFNGIAVGIDGSILYTSDGGLSWEAESSGTTKNLNSVYFAENGYGWAVGDSGTILKADYSLIVGLNEFSVQENKLDIRFYPNPFNTSTTIDYEVNHSSEVSIRIYNHLGELVEVIEQQQQGKQQVTWNAEGLPAGIYYFRLQTGGQVATGKMVLVR